jgi:hypothetical protein
MPEQNESTAKSRKSKPLEEDTENSKTSEALSSSSMEV